MNCAPSAAQISAIFRAIRLTNASDSIAHGPRMNAGSRPPSTTFPTLIAFMRRTLRGKPSRAPESSRFRKAERDVHRLHCLARHAFAEVVERDHDRRAPLVLRNADIREVRSDNRGNAWAFFHQPNERRIPERGRSASAKINI